ncbi:hypothetical protein QTP86_024119 [Hemibagrus guttatus]|nr:hypothetical protein QTP86_024119 [Hemibagrus guttatus]
MAVVVNPGLDRSGCPFAQDVKLPISSFWKVQYQLLIQETLPSEQGKRQAVKTVRAKLSRAFKEVKCAHAERIHGHFQDSGDPWHMWQGTQVITNYNITSAACDSDASLPDMLNNFYAWFEVQNNVVLRKTIPPPDNQVFCLSTTDMKRTLCIVNPWKSAGPDNIPGRVLRECAEELTDVFTSSSTFP